MDEPLRIPRGNESDLSRSGSAASTGILSWPLDPLTQKTLRRFLAGPTAGESGGGLPTGGASTFTDLSDVPASYSGQASKFVAVKVDETGLEFIEPSANDTEVLFRDGDVIAGDSALTWNKTSNMLAVDGYRRINSLTEAEMTLFHSGATPQQLYNSAAMAIAAGESMLIEAFTVATRDSGSAGVAGDSAAYVSRAMFKNVAGTVSIVGSAVNDFEVEDQPAWDAQLVVNSNHPSLLVTGAVNNTIYWVVSLKCYKLTP